MKADDFRSLSLKDLNTRIEEMRRQLFNLHMQLHSNQLTNSNRIRATRRDIARALTIRKELVAQVDGEQS